MSGENNIFTEFSEKLDRIDSESFNGLSANTKTMVKAVITQITSLESYFQQDLIEEEELTLTLSDFNQELFKALTLEEAKEVETFFDGLDILVQNETKLFCFVFYPSNPISNLCELEIYLGEPDNEE